MAPHSSTLAWKIPWMEEPGWAAVHGVTKSRTRLSDFTFTYHFQALEKEMATHSSVLAWRIPGTGEPGGLLSMGLHRVGHDWSDLAAAAANFTLVYCAFPGNFPVTGLLTPFFLFVSRWKWYLSLWLSPSQGVTQFPQGISQVYMR